MQREDEIRVGQAINLAFHYYTAKDIGNIDETIKRTEEEAVKVHNMIVRIQQKAAEAEDKILEQMEQAQQQPKPEPELKM